MRTRPEGDNHTLLRVEVSACGKGNGGEEALERRKRGPRSAHHDREVERESPNRGPIATRTARVTASDTTRKIVGGSGQPCLTPAPDKNAAAIEA